MYGILREGELVNVAQTQEGAKLVVYAPIPYFDQTTHYVIQSAPVERDNYIYMDVEVLEMEIVEDAPTESEE